MFEQESCLLLVQLLNPKVRYMGNKKSLFALDTLRYIYILAIHNVKLPRKRQEKQFVAYPVPVFLAGDKVLIRIHTKDPSNDVAYHIMWHV